MQANRAPYTPFDTALDRSIECGPETPRTPPDPIEPDPAPPPDPRDPPPYPRFEDEPPPRPMDAHRARLASAPQRGKGGRP